MTVDEIITELKDRARGRTRFEGQEPRWDDVLVAEIERLRAENAELRIAAVRLVDNLAPWKRF